eukprot:921339-Pelagomonas_calceolata.AAC.7
MGIWRVSKSTWPYSLAVGGTLVCDSTSSGDKKHAPLVICQPFTVVYSGTRGSHLVLVPCERSDLLIKGRADARSRIVKATSQGESCSLQTDGTTVPVMQTASRGLATTNVKGGHFVNAAQCYNPLTTIKYNT